MTAYLRRAVRTPRVGRSNRLGAATKALVARLRASDYFRVGDSPQFRAGQRRRTRTAARIGLLGVAVAVAVDALALIGLGDDTRLAVAMDLTVLGMSVAGWWALGGRLRHHPELVVGSATLGLAISAVTTGTLVPSLSVQTLGSLLLIPNGVALLIPWRTRTHVRWVLAYAIVAFAYLAIGSLHRFSTQERSHLTVLLTTALVASLAGHVMLQRAHIRSFAQLRRIGLLRRKSERDMVELERLHLALELTARIDPLTGAGNRRQLGEDLRAVRARINRSGFTYGIAEIDLDHFKAINDRSGHAAGDDVLRQVAGAIRNSLRGEDAVYRLGGEEFLVVLHVPSTEGLEAAAERLRTAVLGLGIEHPENQPHGRVTVSVGATFLDRADLDQTDDQWIARADQGLYEAKHAGRNRVCVRQR